MRMLVGVVDDASRSVRLVMPLEQAPAGVVPMTSPPEELLRTVTAGPFNADAEMMYWVGIGGRCDVVLARSVPQPMQSWCIHRIPSVATQMPNQHTC